METKLPTVLIVDDNPDNLRLLFDYLRSSDFSVLVAESGESALKRVAFALPDVILLDILMPGMDGFETCQRLKENPETADIPIIFMTALSDTMEKVRGFRAGAVDYITKPIECEEMLVRINTHMSIHQLQKSLEEQIREKDQLIVELDAFAHTVAHDLKNPLANLIGIANIFRDSWNGMEEDEANQYLDMLETTGTKLTRIVDELLVLASVRKQEIEMSPLNMIAIVDEVKGRLDHLIQSRQGTITTPSGWPEAYGYAPWVEEVWANYISNAIIYGGTPPQVELGGVVQADGMVRFWVRDDGPGIPADTQAKLFTPFTQAEPTSRQGHGLGLSIVQRVMERLGGQVGVESQEGQGSTFYFTLPARV